MRMVRAGTLLVCAAASLLGCAGSRLAPDPPAGLSLAGAWKLDRDPVPVPMGRGVPRDPLERSPMARALLASIGRGDFLTVRQSSGELVLDYGNSQRRFTPGTHSVVSAESGVADQSCGWKGREYVVEVRAQAGRDVTGRYAFSRDGRHLVERLHIAPEELSAVDLTRVYDPTDEIAPRQTPTND